MNKSQEKAMNIAHELVVYMESEQADVGAKEDAFDALWQSIYDVCKLVNYGILDDITEEEYNEGMDWLKQYQELTENYKDFSLEF